MKKKSKGFLITFEGTEGAGKSTLIRELAQKLRVLGQDVVVTREPGGASVAEKIRSIILDEDMNPWTELFLYEAARAEHLHQTILPAIQSGAWVLCDRFTDSTLAYQSYARGLPWKTVKTLNSIATQALQPDLTVLLDIDPETGLRRAQDPNRFEREGVQFQTQVRKGFLKSRKENPRRWLTLKAASGTPDELAREVIKHLRKKLKRTELDPNA